MAEGKSYYSAGTTKHFGTNYPKSPKETKSPLQTLTARQREVLELIARGYTTREIGSKLGISHKTAETHRTQLMVRLGMHKVADLVRYAIHHGMVRADQ